jgi:hypothetical protein
MTDIEDLELAGLSEAELLELGELIDPDVSGCMCTTGTFCQYIRLHLELLEQNNRAQCDNSIKVPFSLNFF